MRGCSHPKDSENQVLRSYGGVVQRVDGPLQRAMCSAQMLLFERSALFCFVTMLVPWDQSCSLPPCY